MDRILARLRSTQGETFEINVRRHFSMGLEMFEEQVFIGALYDADDFPNEVVEL